MIPNTILVYVLGVWDSLPSKRPPEERVAGGGEEAGDTCPIDAFKHTVHHGFDGYDERPRGESSLRVFRGHHKQV